MPGACARPAARGHWAATPGTIPTAHHPAGTLPIPTMSSNTPPTDAARRADLPELPAEAVQTAPGSASAAGGASAAATAASPSSAGGAGTSGDGQVRTPERAPQLLKRAAVILIVAGLFPWVGHGGGWMTLAAAKVVVLLGAWLFFQSIRTRTGEPLPGALAALGGMRWGPKPGERAKGFQALVGHLPTALHLVAALFVLAGVFLPLFDPAEPGFGTAFTEVALLAWGAITFVHISSYERGGGFSPIYPFVFLAPGLGGAVRFLQILADKPIDPLAALGCALAVTSGVIAVYTIGVALAQAKKEGDAKKAAALEARRAARKRGR